MGGNDIQPEATGPVEIRCPETGKMFAKVASTAGSDPNAVRFEIACRDCRVHLNELGGDVALLLHFFNGRGEFTETIVVRRGAHRLGHA